MLRLQYSLILLILAFSWQTRADFPTAKALFEQQEYALAKPKLETLAELGHQEAQYLLSRMYAEGLGVDADLKLAYAWTLITKERGHPLADEQYKELRTQLTSRVEGKKVFHELNSRYGFKALSDTLYPSARTYLKTASQAKAISQKQPSYSNYDVRSGLSAWAVVHYDINENGIVENAIITASFPSDKIDTHVLNAVNSWQFEPPKDLYGDPIRLEMQSHAFSIQTDTGAKGRRFLHENEEYLFKILALANNQSAEHQYLFAVLAENRLVNESDPMSWYLKAAINGHKKAQFRLAQCLITGNGCDKDPSKAVNWLAISADGGDAKAAYLLAQELLDSNNVNYDPRKAAGYLEVAALQEYMPAITEYASLLAMSDDPTIRDPQKAMRLAEQGRTIDANNPNLLATLGVAFIELGQQGRGESMLRQAVDEARKRNWTIANFEDLLADYQTVAADSNAKKPR